VIAIDPERDPPFDSDEILEDTSDLLSICSSLVSIATTTKPTSSSTNSHSGSSQKVVALAHYSVKEYLILERSRKGPAARFSMQAAICNEFLAKSCLGYLLQFGESNPISNKNVGDFKLSRYSARFWITHAQSVSLKAISLNRLIIKLFSTETDAYLSWIRLYDPDRHSDEPYLERKLETIPTPLYYASLSGLSTIVELLLGKGADVNVQGGRYGNALQAASYKGHSAIVELLLGKGADVNAHGGYYGNALQAASERGLSTIVELLVGKGASSVK
jgi:hypothetical protein